MQKVVIMILLSSSLVQAMLYDQRICSKEENFFGLLEKYLQVSYRLKQKKAIEEKKITTYKRQPFLEGETEPYPIPSEYPGKELQESYFKQIERELRKKTVDVNQKVNGMTPLFFACASSGNIAFPKIVQLLLGNKANPNILNDKDCVITLVDGVAQKVMYSPLTGAIVQHKSLKVVNLLLNFSADPTQLDLAGKSPFDYVKECTNSAVMALLSRTQPKMIASSPLVLTRSRCPE